MKRFFKIILVLLGLTVFGSIAAAGAGLFLFWQYGKGLPDYQKLAVYEPAVMTRVHADDGRLLAEYATEKRIFVPIRAMPKRVINAVLSAEDKNFYIHPGIDPLGMMRAILTNIKNYGSGRRPVGASTITQQVAKNFLLTNEVSYVRKIKEAILAFRIERAFSKDRILELYLNEVYLGSGSYGIAAAALNYFNKSPNDLTIAEAAYLAALLKAPSNYHPVRRKAAALERRNWVIGRMTEDGYITAEQARLAKADDLVVVRRDDEEFVTADYFAEEVRRVLYDKYGEDALYTGGLSVHTTLDPRLQEIAERTLRAGLIEYDRRHGWRGPLARIEGPGDTLQKLNAMPLPKGMGTWQLAVVTAIEDQRAVIRVQGTGAVTSPGTIPVQDLKWARKWLKGEYLGDVVHTPGDVLVVGDVVAVEAVSSDPTATYALRQIPEIQGSIVALDPHSGRVLAMSGGYDYRASEFNRATQAKRQPGSAFKPFVYLTALDSGFSPSTLILDAPFVVDQGPGAPKWRPANYTNKFYGPSTMRLGIEKSRNLMTVRLAQTVGMDKISDYAERFGITKNLPTQLSMALGAGETTLLDLTSAYAMLVNGGKQITPTFIDRIQDRNGKSVYRHDTRPCVGCNAVAWTGQAVPNIPDTRKQLTDPTSAYQIVSMLEGTVQRGTGRRVKAVGKPLGGKTGTTNAARDAWFIGFSPDLAVGVFTGFDEPRSLGPREQGASVASPIFRDFMKDALAGQPPVPFRIPPGVRLVRVNATTGLPARSNDRNVILEAFKPGTVPTDSGQIVGADGTNRRNGNGDAPAVGTGGLY